MVVVECVRSPTTDWVYTGKADELLAARSRPADELAEQLHEADGARGIGKHVLLRVWLRLSTLPVAELRRRAQAEKQ